MRAGRWCCAGGTGSRRPERPARRGRRLLRLTVLVTIGWFVIAGWAPAASAMTPRWPSLPLSRLTAWLAGSPVPRVPVQRGGTAAGRPHYVPASATRAGRGAGRRPGRGPGQLPPYHPYAPVARRYLTKALPGGGFNPATSRLVAPASTATSSLYRNTDGSYTKMVYPGPVNYRATSGSYRPINAALVAAGHRWRETANSVAVSAASLASSRSVGLAGFSGGDSAGFGLAGAVPVTGTVAGPVITYPGALPGTNLSETAGADGIAASLVLHSAGAASTWLFPLRLRGLTAAPASGGVISLRNAAGTAVAEVTPPVASDARLSAGPGAVTGQVVAYHGGQALQVSLSHAWLAAAARAFPVTVSFGVRGLTGNGAAAGSTYVDPPPSPGAATPTPAPAGCGTSPSPATTTSTSRLARPRYWFTTAQRDLPEEAKPALRQVTRAEMPLLPGTQAHGPRSTSKPQRASAR